MAQGSNLLWGLLLYPAELSCFRMSGIWTRDTQSKQRFNQKSTRTSGCNTADTKELCRNSQLWALSVNCCRPLSGTSLLHKCKGYLQRTIVVSFSDSKMFMQVCNRTAQLKNNFTGSINRGCFRLKRRKLVSKKTSPRPYCANRLRSTTDQTTNCRQIRILLKPNFSQRRRARLR